MQWTFDRNKRIVAGLAQQSQDVQTIRENATATAKNKRLTDQQTMDNAIQARRLAVFNALQSANNAVTSHQQQLASAYR